MRWNTVLSVTTRSVSLLMWSVCILGILLLFAQVCQPAQPTSERWLLYSAPPYYLPALSRTASVLEAPEPVVRIELAREEFEPGVLAIANVSEPPVTLEFKIIPQAPEDETVRPLPLSNLRLATIAHLWMPGSDREIPDALPILGSNLITVPAGETRYLWLTVDSRGLSAGEYILDLQVRQTNATRPLPDRGTARLEVTVWPFVADDSIPPWVWTWDYGNALQNDVWYTNFREHRVNSWHLPLTGPPPMNPDGSLAAKPSYRVEGAWGRPEGDLGEYVRRGLQSGGIFLLDTASSRAFCAAYWGGGWKRTDGESEPYMSPAWCEAFRTYITGLVKCMEAAGADYEDWYFYPYDEYMGRDFLRLAHLVKQIDPNIQIFVDDFTYPRAAHCGRRCRREGHDGDEDYLPRWLPYADLWCVQRLLVDRHPEAYQQFAAVIGDTPISNYFAGEKVRHLDPFILYRYISWQAARLGLDGISFWTPTGYSGDGWAHGRWQNFPDVIYRDYTNQPINTIRWECFRDGVDDFLYIKLLREQIEKLPASSENRQAAEQLIAEAIASFPREVRSPEQYEQFMQHRRRLAEAIIELSH